MDTQIRENGVGALDTSQPQPNSLQSDINYQSFHEKNSINGTEDSIDGKHGTFTNTLEDVRSIIDGDESDGGENPTHYSSAPYLSAVETDPLIWTPPAPMDIEDDLDSVANNDDDDECSDGTKWGKPSSLSGFDEEQGNSFKEERQKVIMDAMNGQFKLLVSRLLASEDITSEAWLDIVASLSWEAALLIKPEANKGKAMDPGSYVKVKCVGSGAPSESEVVKGLVFKKNTAHKHMPTKCKNPKLLILQGVLGHRELGLSSFDAMEEENDYMKSINEMIESCHPNVVLVEKSVSRDIQEFLLKKGMTLVYDMKLTRLNRIARCIGSPVLSCSDILTNPKVKQCDMFHIEKFPEEHSCSKEGGKRPCKTLMFLEGFPKALGCTIMLKGAPFDELKKVKRVVQYTVFAAYNLILETSFFADQRASFSDMGVEGNFSLNNSFIEENPDGITQAVSSDIPTSNGSLENSTHEALFSGSNLNPDGSLQSPQFTLDVDCNDNCHSKPNSDLGIQSDVPWQLVSSFSSSLKKFLSDSFAPINLELLSSYYGFSDEELDTCSQGDCRKTEANGDFIQEKALDEISNIEKSDPSLSFNDSVENKNADISSKDEVQSKDGIEKVLEPESILILISSQCVAKGVVCEQSHFSRIKYYGNLDVSLGQFLQDTLLNKKHICSSCNEPPEAHLYCYTHQNGNLTVMVRQLDPGFSLSGESEGRIWMWTRCLKCEDENGIASSTRRVVMSQAARGLSFGKFLELSFSSHSVASRLSSQCGHSLHRDCLRFFGLGSKLAMFRYSPVEIYTACKPPPVLEFHNANGQEWIKGEAKLILQKGERFFSEVAHILQKLKHGDFCAVKDHHRVEDMLMQEKSEFETSLLKAINFSGKQGKALNDILSLSWLSQELLFVLYIWDCRLNSLLHCRKDNVTSHHEIQEQSIQDNQNSTEDSSMNIESSIPNHAQIDDPNFSNLESEMEMGSAEISESVGSDTDNSLDCEIADSHSSSGETVSGQMTKNTSSIQKENVPSSEHILETQDTKNDWIWAPASELQRTYRKDLHGGSLQKFEFVASYTPKHLSRIQLNPDEKAMLHFPFGLDGSVVSVCEDEISSIIACALALSKDNSDEKEAIEDKTMDNSSSIMSSDGSTVPSSYWSSTGSLESEGMRTSQSVSSLYSDESSNSGSESSFVVDRSVPPENLHPTIHLGKGKAATKNNYSVVVVHSKQFYALRRICCPSELAYISSLSRCKKWDAQGGKSKAFFAKTLDDRFIIKQVKKTEVDSFLEFAPNYFQHITYSISSGSQTCLAKILGIYQVKQSKGGKEVKFDLMVMENLLYGRNFTRIYDLKGAVFSRYVSDDSEKVLLDQNFVEDTRISPMYMAGREKLLFQRAIWNDTSFLNAVNVMDYSLLVGVDKQRHELVFGIIDYLRQYTWDKQLETWVKSSLVVPKNSLPTVISPKEYKKRFRKFMSKYFLTVPDTWSCKQCSGPCNCCNDIKSSSVESCQDTQISAVHKS